MDTTKRIEIEHLCARLVTAYCLTIDVNDYPAFMELFAPDAEWQRPAPLPLLRGHAEFRQYLDSRDTSILLRHVPSNVQVDVIDADNAKGISYVTAYRCPNYKGGVAPMEGPFIMVEYRDRFVRTPSGWRIGRRNTVVVFAK